MSKGNYVVTAIENDTDIAFNLTADADKDLPPDQQDLIFAVGSAVEIIRTIYKDDQKSFADYFAQLISLAKLGLEGENAQPALAQRALEHIKIEIIDREAGKVKNQYLRKLGAKALLLGLPFFVAGTAINFLHTHLGMRSMNKDYTDLASLMLMWSGTMVGVWLSFAITRTIIGFEDLTIIEKDRLEPTVRLVFTGILSIVFGLLFIKNAISIQLGSFTSDNILKDPVTAFLIGVVLGLNEKIVGSTLTKKTSTVLDKV
jgi:hypothetical protein